MSGKRERRERANKQFDEAWTLARAGGLHLKQCSDVHYQLVCYGPPKWILNVFPGNFRLYADPKLAVPPFATEIAGKWTLPQLVASVLESMNGTEAIVPARRDSTIATDFRIHGGMDGIS